MSSVDQLKQTLADMRKKLQVSRKEFKRLSGQNEQRQYKIAQYQQQLDSLQYESEELAYQGKSTRKLEREAKTIEKKANRLVREHNKVLDKLLPLQMSIHELEEEIYYLKDFIMAQEDPHSEENRDYQGLKNIIDYALATGWLIEAQRVLNEGSRLELEDMLSEVDIQEEDISVQLEEISEQLKNRVAYLTSKMSVNKLKDVFSYYLDIYEQTDSPIERGGFRVVLAQLLYIIHNLDPKAFNQLQISKIARIPNPRKNDMMSLIAVGFLGYWLGKK